MNYSRNFFKSVSLCLVLLSLTSNAQEWVTWAQEKYLTGYYTDRKFNNFAFDVESQPKLSQFPRFTR